MAERPLDGVRLTLTPKDRLQDGSFRFDGLAEGEYMLRLVAPEFESHSRKLRIAGSERTEIILAPTTSEEN